MKTMYPGVANSPETFLTSALAADGTIMYLADGSVLGTLPTYAVIGDTASAETVLVQSKGADGGYNIQRAVEGVAIAWPQATLVARNFTNADYAALVDNVNTLDENKLDQSDMDAFQEEVQTALDGMSDDLANVQQEQATMQTEQAAKDAAQDESIAACALKTEIPTVVNDLSTGGETAALSAEQGKVLKASVDAANGTIATLDEEVDGLSESKADKTELETLEGSVQAAQTAQAEKDAAQDESIAACALKTEIPTIVDDLTTGGTTAALSAEQGKALKADVDAAAASFDEWKVPWTAERAAKLDNLDALDTDGVLANIDATVSSRASQTSVNALQDDVTALLQQASGGGSSVIKSVQRGAVREEYLSANSKYNINISKVNPSKAVVIGSFNPTDSSSIIVSFVLNTTGTNIEVQTGSATARFAFSWQVLEFK